MVASLRRRSSKGVPGVLWSAIAGLFAHVGLWIGVRLTLSKVDLREEGIREERDESSEARALRKTVWGTTPNFWSSMSPTIFKFVPTSGSLCNRDAKLFDQSALERAISLPHTSMWHWLA